MLGSWNLVPAKQKDSTAGLGLPGQGGRWQDLGSEAGRPLAS